MKINNLDDACSVISILIKPVLPPPLPPQRRQKREIIAGGDPVRTPIDRTAAMVTAKAHWYFQPPQQTKIMATERTHIQATKTSDFGRTTSKGEEIELSRAIAAQVPNRYRDAVEKDEELVQRAKEAVDAITYIAEHQQAAWMNMEDVLDAHIKTLRNKKQAADFESRQMIASLKDMSNFMNDDRTITAIQQANEFIAIIERLEELSTSPFFSSFVSSINPKNHE
jgi:hypothetical protein